MGNQKSKEEIYKENQEFAQKCLKDVQIEVQFPGFLNDKEALLQQQKNINMIFCKLPQLIDKLVKYAGGPAVIGPIGSALMSLMLDSPSSIQNAMTMLKMEDMIAQNAHSFIKAKMEGIKRQWDFFLLGNDRIQYLINADASCYELLVMFNDPDFYLRKKPLVFAPFLTSFAAVFVVITRASCQLISSDERRKDAVRNLETLREVILFFQEETIKHRNSYLEIGLKIDLYTSYILDEFNKTKIDFKNNQFRIGEFYEGRNDAVLDLYKAKIKRKYESYFELSLSAVTDEAICCDPEWLPFHFIYSLTCTHHIIHTTLQ